MVVDAEGRQSPAVPDGKSSGWTVNWWGVVSLLIIVALLGVTWRWLAGSDSDSSEQLSVVGTSVPTGTSETTTSTTARPPTRSAPPTTQRSGTTAVATERQVVISGEMQPCRFGASCLVASFAIEGFDKHPGRFTCIYPNSRSDFSFNNDEVEGACLTADEGDTLTIEVDGVRSATISEQDLDGT